MRVSAIVVAFARPDALRRCLLSLERALANVAGASELIVIDNGGLQALIRECAPAALVLEQGRNVGFAAAVSSGLAAARGEWIALVNDDATLEPDALARLLQAGASGPRVGAVAAQVRFASDPGVINSAGIEVDALGIASERLAGRPLSAGAQAREVFGASACAGLYRAAMLAELGGFDGRYFAYLEDVDLAWRARAAGWRALYEPRAVAYHEGSASSGEGSSRKYFLVGRNRIRLLARNASARQLARYWPAMLLYDGAYVAYAALVDRELAPLRGRLAGLRCWHALRRETDGMRGEVKLAPAWSGWRAALRQHRAYRDFGA